MSEVEQVGEALRKECLAIFGSTWSYDVAWRLARAAIKEMRRDDEIERLRAELNVARGMTDSYRQAWKSNSMEYGK